MAAASRGGFWQIIIFAKINSFVFATFLHGFIIALMLRNKQGFRGKAY